MTVTTPPSDRVDHEGLRPRSAPPTFSPEPGGTRVDVPLGRRVMVVSDLLLTPDATPSTIAVTSQLARALDTWDGPGILIIAGNLFDLSGCAAPVQEARRALDAHPDLARALAHFLTVDERRVIRQTGTHEPGYDTDPEAIAAVAARGVEQFGPVDLHLRTTTGVRVVRVEPGEHAYASGAGAPETEFDPAADAKPGVIGHSPAGRGWRSLAAQSEEDAPWLAGLNRLSDPSALSRFVVSRTLYRRLGRYAWWLLVPFAVAGLLRVAVTPWVSGHLGTGLPGRAIRQAHQADFGDQVVIAATVSLVVLVVLALVLGLLSRRMWSILGGGALEIVQAEAGANDAARDAARRLVGRGYAGLITAATFQSELTHLGLGFYANVGATAEVVEEHRGRLGLPPVFLQNQRVSWVELETGAELHVRMLLARNELRSPNVLERLVTRGRNDRSLHPVAGGVVPDGRVVAPGTGPAPGPPADPPGAPVGLGRHPLRRPGGPARRHHPSPAGPPPRRAAVPPAPGQRGGRGADRHGRTGPGGAGPGHPPRPAPGLAGGRDPAGRHHPPPHHRRRRRRGVAVRPGRPDPPGGQPSGTSRPRRTGPRSGRPWWPWPSAWSGSRCSRRPPSSCSSTSAATTTRTSRGGRHSGRSPSGWSASGRCGSPTWPTAFLAPSLLAIGLTIVALALFLLTRPVVDRRLTSGRTAEFRARDIVRRHGVSTLDYFALRSDKKWFFHRDSLVAYAVYGGVCLISPDPIGPRNEREQTWGAFRRFADSHGWVTAVMGAGEDWLSVYRDSGMHHIYLGDEAVVRVQSFTLSGGSMKGLRQAHNRITEVRLHGHVPRSQPPRSVTRPPSCTALMSLSRQGEHERGFSMMLGRVFDPRDTDLLLTVVRGPDGAAAAMCQFVPARGINGYSLDLMRRDPGDHPNGLLDFALVSTIEPPRATAGTRGSSLNFATLRSTLSGDKGDGTVQRAERWFLKRLSSFAQIESLWRFNAKYEPEWLPRYVVFDTAEHLVPVVMAIMRAESLWEIPVLGRLLAAGAEKAHARRPARRPRHSSPPRSGNLDQDDDTGGPTERPVDGGAGRRGAPGRLSRPPRAGGRAPRCCRPRPHRRILPSLNTPGPDSPLGSGPRPRPGSARTGPGRCRPPQCGDLFRRTDPPAPPRPA